MAAPLESAWNKLIRANLHAQAGYQWLAKQIPPNNAQLSSLKKHVEHDGPLSLVVAWAGDFPDIERPELGLILGDAISNYRAVLDHLAWALVRKFGQRGLTVKAKRKIYFPFSRSRKEFEKGVGVWLPGVPKNPFLTTIRTYQLYQRGQIPSALRLLNRLSNTDKHRTLTTALWIHQKTDSTLTFPETLRLAEQGLLVPRSGRVKPNTYLFRAGFTKLDPAVGEDQVQLNLDLLVVPVIGKRLPITPTLQRISTAIETILRTVGGQMGLRHGGVPSDWQAPTWPSDL